MRMQRGRNLHVILTAIAEGNWVPNCQSRSICAHSLNQHAFYSRLTWPEFIWVGCNADLAKTHWIVCWLCKFDGLICRCCNNEAIAEAIVNDFGVSWSWCFVFSFVRVFSFQFNVVLAFFKQSRFTHRSGACIEEQLKLAWYTSQAENLFILTRVCIAEQLELVMIHSPCWKTSFIRKWRPF